jgi:FYVE zinc finger
MVGCLLHVLQVNDCHLDDDQMDEDGDSSDEEFHYPGSHVDTVRPDSVLSNRTNTTDYFSRSGASRTPSDLTPHLSQAPEFRVPTHEVPQKVLTPRWTTPSPHQLHAQWERDESVHECRDCHRRFNFINRRVRSHRAVLSSFIDRFTNLTACEFQYVYLMRRLSASQHCRKCGHIFCDRCSSYRALLDPSDVVQDPACPEGPSTASSHRVCHSCYDEVTATVPSALGVGTTSMERIVVGQERLSIPGNLSRRQSTSQLSDLSE